MLHEKTLRGKDANWAVVSEQTQQGWGQLPSRTSAQAAVPPDKGTTELQKACLLSTWGETGMHPARAPSGQRALKPATGAELLPQDTSTQYFSAPW